MKIQPFILGFGYTNSYVVYYDDRSAYIIDAPNGTKKLQTFIEQNNLKAEAVFLTHGHYDHILGLPELRKAYKNIDIYIGKEDFCFLEDEGKANRELLWNQREILEQYKDVFSSLPEDLIFYDKSITRNGEKLFDVIKTPGHTPGSVCLYSKKDNVLFSGDTLFKEGVGRWDFGGNYSDLCKSIDKLKSLEESTLVFPGHGEFTTIAFEKENNPYL